MDDAGMAFVDPRRPAAPGGQGSRRRGLTLYPLAEETGRDVARPNWEYVRVDVKMPSHPKIVAMPRSSRWILLELWCYCGEHLTDGFVPEKVWRSIGRSRERAPILENGLAKPVPGGYEMHDYLEHQRSRNEVAAVTSARRASGSKGGRASAAARPASSEASKKPDGSQTEANQKPQVDHNTGHGRRQPRSATEASQTPVDNPGPQVAAPNPNAESKQTLEETPSKRLRKRSSKNQAEAEAEAEVNPPVAEALNSNVESTPPSAVKLPDGKWMDEANGQMPPDRPGIETERRRQINALAEWQRQHPEAASEPA